MAKISTGALEYDPLEERIINILEMSVPHNWKGCISNPNTRFKYYNHVIDFILYGIKVMNSPTNKIQDITTELHYLLTREQISILIYKENMIAKEINKKLWIIYLIGKKKRNIKRSLIKVIQKASGLY